MLLIFNINISLAIILNLIKMNTLCPFLLLITVISFPDVLFLTLIKTYSQADNYKVWPWWPNSKFSSQLLVLIGIFIRLSKRHFIVPFHSFKRKTTNYCNQSSNESKVGNPLRVIILCLTPKLCNNELCFFQYLYYIVLRCVF